MSVNTPKYAIIQTDLIKQIECENLSAGNELPSESELMAHYGVSRVTIRRAIDELYRLGYIEKMRGKRAFVKGTPKSQELSTISSYTEEILRQGMIPSRKIVNAEIRICTQQEMDCLNLQKGDPVFHLERIYFADDKPLCFTQTTLPYQLFRNIDTYDFSQNSLYDVIEHSYNMKISHSNLKLKAVPAFDKVANYLNVSNNTPLLYSFAITSGVYETVDIPIEMFTTYYLTDRFEYSLIQSRN